MGSLHDDALLVCRSLALDQFPSPLVLRTRTRAPVKEKGAAVQVGSSSSSSSLPHALCVMCLLCNGDGLQAGLASQQSSCQVWPLPLLLAVQLVHAPFPALKVVASIVHERLVGVDVAVKTVVPPGARLAAQGQGQLTKQPLQEQQPGSNSPLAIAAAGYGSAGGEQRAEPVPAPEPVRSSHGRPAAVAPSNPPRRLSGRAAEAPSGPRRAVPAPAAPPSVYQGAAPAAAPAGLQQQQWQPPLVQQQQQQQLSTMPLPTAAAAAAAAAAGTGGGRWRSFVGAPAAPTASPAASSAAQQQQQRQPPVPQARQQLPSQSRWPLLGGAGGQPQLGALAPVAATQVPAAPPAQVSASAFAACRPPSRTPSMQPGGLFSQFAFSATKPAVPARPGPAQQSNTGGGGGGMPHGLLGRGLLGSSTPAATQQEQQEQPEAAAKRRKLSAFLAAAHLPAAAQQQPAAGAAVELRAGPTVVAPASAPAAAPPGSRSALHLPKLGFLSSRFAPAAASQPSPAQPAQAVGQPATAAVAVPPAPPAEVAPAAPEFAAMFCFL